jgi:hypothetical protein
VSQEAQFDERNQRMWLLWLDTFNASTLCLIVVLLIRYKPRQYDVSRQAQIDERNQHRCVLLLLSMHCSASGFERVKM